jgi:hypothetical protein
MKVVHLVEGHNFHVDWHFKFWVENCEKPLARQMLLFFRTGRHSKLARRSCKIRREKHPRAFVKVVEGSEIYNFPIHCSVHFSGKILRKIEIKRAKPCCAGYVASRRRATFQSAPRALPHAGRAVRTPRRPATAGCEHGPCGRQPTPVPEAEPRPAGRAGHASRRNALRRGFPPPVPSTPYAAVMGGSFRGEGQRPPGLKTAACRLCCA